MTTPKRSFIGSYLEALRPHQWAKNLLVLVPLLTSHSYADGAAVMAALLAFAAFSLVASGGYLLNDLVDYRVDRAHATKKDRPIAAGRVPIAAAWAGVLALPLAGFGLALDGLPATFTQVLGLYYFLTLAYSLVIKRIVILDVICLAALYALRVAAGAAAIAVPLSSWLALYALFLFLSLATLKRYVELTRLPEAQTDIPGRGYRRADLATLFAQGTASGVVSVLVLAFYISGDGVTGLYAAPQMLWGLCLLMMYWVSHLWLLARRGEMPEDPVLFALTDNVSLGVGAALVAIVALARIGGLP